MYPLQAFLPSYTVSRLSKHEKLKFRFRVSLFSTFPFRHTDKGTLLSRRAFSSPNMLPLAKVGISIDIDWRSVLRPTAVKSFRVHKELCQDVATLRLFPGITTSSVKAFLSSPLKGVGECLLSNCPKSGLIRLSVLCTYGAGNCPQRPDLLKAFKEATARGVVIVNITQCQKGTVEALCEQRIPLKVVEHTDQVV